MTISTTIKTFSAVIIGCCILLCILIAKLYQASSASNLAVIKEITLTTLADELSVSDSELVQFARVFVVTGNPQAEQAYMAILLERNGGIPRKSTRFQAPGKQIPLTSLIQIHGCTPKELEKIRLAEKMSNELVLIEIKAINARKGLLQNDSGQYVIQGAPDQAYAIKLLFNEFYDEKLQEIQKVLYDFSILLRARTQDEIIETSRRVRLNIILLIITIALVFLSAVLSAWYCHYQVSRPLKKITEFAKRVADGDTEADLYANPSAKFKINS